MSNSLTRTVANVILNQQEPTSLSRATLFQWIVWQYPRARAGGLCGAVKPPVADHGWYPAILHLETAEVQVFAHLDDHYDSPESAVDYFDTKEE